MNSRASIAELREGLEFEEMSVGPITRTHIVRYAGASGDFNPLHHDDEYARGLGNPSIFAMGMFPAGVLATAVTRWLGAEHVRRLSVRFQSRVWPGDKLTFKGKVIKKHSDGTKGTALCELCVVNQNGEAVLTGEAEAEFVLNADGGAREPSQSAGASEVG